MTKDDILGLAGGFCESALLHETTAWGLFEQTRAPRSAQQVSEALGLRPDKAGIVMDALTALGFLERVGALYRNTPVTDAHLIEGAPDDLRSYVRHMKAQWRHWHDLDAVLQARAPLDWQQDKSVFGEPAAHELLLEGVAQEGATLIERVASLPVWARCENFIDAGGGHGRYAIALVQRYPQLRGEIWDTELSRPVALRHIRSAGVDERIGFRGIDLLAHETWTASGRDAVLLANVVANFGEARIRELIGRASLTVKRGGVVVVVSPWLDDERTGPLSGAMFAIHMMVACEEGWLPPEGFLRDCLRAAGLEVRVERLTAEDGVWIGVRR